MGDVNYGHPALQSHYSLHPNSDTVKLEYDESPTDSISRISDISVVTTLSVIGIVLHNHGI